MTTGNKKNPSSDSVTATEKIRKIHVKNLIQKIINGKTVTAGQLKIVEDYYREIENKKRVPSLRSLAKEIGISFQKMSEWADRPGFPPKSKDGWDVEACRNFRDAQLATASDRCGRGNGGTGDLTSLQRQRIKKLEHENAMLVIRLERMRGEQIPADEVQSALTFLTAQFIAALDNLLNRVGNECKSTPQAIESVGKAIAATRIDLTGWISNAANYAGIVQPDAAATANDDLEMARK